MKSIFIRCSSILATAFLTVVGINNASAQFCDQDQGGPGFPSDATCEAAVCAMDPFCCDTQWDQICGDMALTLTECANCITGGGGGGGPFCDEDQLGGLGFPSDATCEAAVCAIDSFCCTNGWDQLCGDQAAALAECAGCVNPAPPAAPANDLCGDAEPISCGAIVSGTTVDATADAAPVCGTTNTSPGVWYSLTGVTAGSVVTASLCTGTAFDSKISVFTGGCGVLTCVSGNDDFCGLQSETTFVADGSDYLILVHSFGGATGPFQLAVDCATVVPPIPWCSTATPIACNSVETGTTVGAPTDPIPFSTVCGTTNGAGGKVAYTVTGTGLEITASLLGSSYDTKIWVYESDGTCEPTGLTCVGGNDDFGGLQSQFSWLSTLGQEYLIVVGGFGTSQGAYSLEVICDEPCLDNEITLNLFDSFGDGWDAATYNIINLQTATIEVTGTLGSGSLGTDLLCLVDGCYNITVTGGFFPGEISWELVNVDGGPITGGAPASIDFSVNTANCQAIGCTDITATNYDPTALVDNGACVNCGGDLLLEITMTDNANNGWGGATYSIVNVNNGTTVATGGLASADTGNPLSNGTDYVCIPEGCYVFNVTGGNNPVSLGWEINDVIGNFYGSNTGNVTNFPLSIALGNPACSFPGCTNPDAINFEPSASVDDGSCIIPPANNEVCDAEAVTCGLTVSGTTINATDAEGLIGTTCGPFPVTSPGVWYEFNSASDQFVIASTCGTVGTGDTRIHVYSGDCNNLTCVTSNDDGCETGFYSSIGFNAVTGGNYFIYVSEFGVGTGINFDLEITCVTCDNGAPTNDDCVAAFPQVSGLAVTGSTCCNAPSGAPNFIAGFASAYDQWYVFNSSNFDTFFFELNNIDGDAVGLMIYDGDCNTLVDVAGCFVAGTCAGSIEDFLTLQPNTDYYFAVFALDPTGCGEFTFETVGVNLGCTDQAASNFDPDANQDDGSCEYVGVTPPNDECADAIVLNCGDAITGSTGGAAEFVPCPTAAVPATCPVVPPAGVDTSLQCYTDVVNGDPFCCNNTWDGVCQAAYDACVGACGGTGVVWYTIVGTGDIINVSACGSVIAANATVTESAAGCAGPFTNTTLLAESEPCDFFNADDTNPSFLSVAGVTYYVQVSSANQGSFVLDVTCTPAVFGCTNPVAYNYDPAANIDDQSCDFFSGTCTAGGTPVLFNMIDSFGDGWNNATYEIADGLGTVISAGTLDDADFFVDEDNFVGPEFGFDFVCLQDGCYTITVDGGLFPTEVSWNIEDENGNILAAGGPGSFDLVIGANTVCGCTNTGACNFDPAATSEDGSCEFDSCAGCTDISACNFDNAALIDDGSCCFENCVVTDLIPVAGTGLFEVYSIDGTLVTSVSPSACLTCAVVPPAGVDTNTACYQDVVANDPFCCNTAWDTFCQGAYDACAAGSPDICSAADPVLCLPDGCYYVVASGVSWTLFGVNGGFISGGDAEAGDFVSFSVGSITCQIGCTEPLACNFDPSANVPDCTLCEFNSCLGCTYADATNFDATAGIDDGSCVFDLSSDCPADLNSDGLINASDLSLFLQSFGTFCPN